MVFRFKEQSKYLEAHEYLLRVLQSFSYNHKELTIEIDRPDQSLVKRIMEICGECKSADSLLAKELVKNNVAG